ncbi:Hypothetical_protein [Hexamita inflata]|uniref:Hypothetical_protein n=1 Tax=Hexamita inflata TaxID=28002 RepID=A0ABP1HW63_9EUKA
MRHIQNQLRTFQNRHISSSVKVEEQVQFDYSKELDMEYICVYFKQNVGNMKLSQTLAIILQKQCLQNYTDILIFDKSLRALILLKPYLTETSLLSEFVTLALANTSVFIDTVDADKLTRVLNFFIVFQDYITPIQSDAIRIHIITILKKIQEQSPLSNYVGMSRTLLQLIQVTLQQHQLEFLTKSQAEELARHIATNSSYLIIPYEIAQVLWKINARYDIMNIVNDSLTNSNAIMIMIQTLLEISKILTQHAYEFKFSQQLTDFVLNLIPYDKEFYKSNLLEPIDFTPLSVSSSIYITGQVIAGAPIKMETRKLAFSHLSRRVCRSQNEQDLLSFCMEVLAQ